MGSECSPTSDLRLRVHVREGVARRCRVLGPAVHAAGHDDLRHELGATWALLPLLEKREESECQPIGTDGVHVHRVVEVLLRDWVKVCLLERVGGGYCRLLELAPMNT